MVKRSLQVEPVGMVWTSILLWHLSLRWKKIANSKTGFWVWSAVQVQQQQQQQQLWSCQFPLSTFYCFCLSNSVAICLYNYNATTLSCFNLPLCVCVRACVCVCVSMGVSKWEREYNFLQPGVAIGYRDNAMALIRLGGNNNINNKFSFFGIFKNVFLLFALTTFVREIGNYHHHHPTLCVCVCYERERKKIH